MLYKFADDTSVVGLITKEDESSYRREITEMVRWCEENNLILNISKTKEMIIDFRKKISSPLSLGALNVQHHGSEIALIQ